MPPPQGSRYHAFISYAAEDNRAPRNWASWLQELLQEFETPRNIAGRPTPFGPVPARLEPVFTAERTGQDELSGSSRQALEQSRTMIVVCSPAAVRSKAVTEEIRYFKQLGRDRVIALIVFGEPDAENAERECFPETLKYEVNRDGTLDREWRVHPIAVDARAQSKSGPSQAERLAEARRLIVAAVLGVPPDAIPRAAAAAEGDDRLERPERRRKTGAGMLWVAVTCVLAAGALGWFAYDAWQKQQAAEAARRRADELIVFIQRNLREKLARSGQIGVLAEINARITAHLTNVAHGTKDPAALGALADAFGDSAEIMLSRGNDLGALDAALQSAQTRQRVAELAESPADTPLLLIGDQRRVARILRKLARHQEALTVAEQSRTLAAALSRKRLGDSEVEEELARTHAEVADAFVELGRLDEAMRAYASGRDILRRLAGATPEDRDLQQEFARVTERIADLKQRTGDFPGALVDLKDWEKLIEAQATAAPTDWQAQAALSAASLRVGTLLAGQRKYSEAADYFRKAVEIGERFAKEQPTDRAAQMAYVTACRMLGAAVAEADPAGKTEALAWFQRALDHLDRHFPGDKDLHATTLRTEIQQVRDAVAGQRPK